MSFAADEIFCKTVQICLYKYKSSRPCFHEVTVVRKIVTQSECNYFSLPSLRENSDEVGYRYILALQHKVINSGRKFGMIFQTKPPGDDLS